MPREMILVDYDPDWPRQFTEIHRQLSDIFGPLAVEIQHFGSTAVPGLCAKPILDVMVLVHDIASVDTLNGPMAEAGYLPRGENGIPGRRYYQKPDRDGVNHTQHIHCYEPGHPHAVNELLFRDFLIADPVSRQKYREVKQQACALYRFSPAQYTDYKTACVLELLEQARRWAAQASAPMDTTFGERLPGTLYHNRQGAYLLCVQEGRLAVIQTVKGLFLPGGGIEVNETQEDCLRRELLEETGYTSVLHQYLGAAEQYCKHDELGWFHPIQFFYSGALTAKVREPVETDHLLLWIEPAKASEAMVLPTQRWAVEHYLLSR